MSPRATSKATKRYAEEHPAAPGYYRTWRGLTVSSLGFGSYLGKVTPEAREDYEASALTALRNGVNVLDTAINYRRQASERDLGRALERFGHRDQVLVATKGGFLTGDVDREGSNEEIVQEELLDPGVITLEDIVGGMHCMTPAYLRDQLHRSLQNLGVDAVDVYMVHNPETQLQHDVPRGTFEERLREAFVELERQVDAGRIGVYGLATWDGLRVPPDHDAHVGLERALELAVEAREVVNAEDDVDRTHHLGAVELPVNLAMPEAGTEATQPWEGDLVTALEAAHRADLLVLASASLFQTRVLGRIHDEVRKHLDAEGDLEAAMEFARSAPGVTSALVGMGDPAHAEENTGLMTKREPMPDAVVEMLER